VLGKYFCIQYEVFLLQWSIIHQT